jgi:hypothetical protein
LYEVVKLPVSRIASNFSPNARALVSEVGEMSVVIAVRSGR